MKSSFTIAQMLMTLGLAQSEIPEPSSAPKTRSTLNRLSQKGRRKRARQRASH